MARRHVIFAILFGVVIAVAMRYMLGGSLVIHALVAVGAALLAAWLSTRAKTGVPQQGKGGRGR